MHTLNARTAELREEPEVAPRPPVAPGTRYDETVSASETLARASHIGARDLCSKHMGLADDRRGVPGHVPGSADRKTGELMEEAHYGERSRALVRFSGCLHGSRATARSSYPIRVWAASALPSSSTTQSRTSSRLKE